MQLAPHQLQYQETYKGEVIRIQIQHLKSYEIPYVVPKKKKKELLEEEEIPCAESLSSDLRDNYSI